MLNGIARLVMLAACLLPPVALLARPVHAQPAPQWIGTWVNGEERTTLAITGSTLSLAWPDAPAPERYNWTARRYGTPRDLAAWGYAPGLYFAYDQTDISADGIRSTLDAAWASRLGMGGGLSGRYAVLRSRVDRIRPGRYVRLRRFCVGDRRSAADCLSPTRNEFIIFDGGHLVLILIDPSAPDTSNVLYFTRATASAAVEGRR